MADLTNVDMDSLESSSEDFDRVSNILSFDPFDETPADDTPAPSDEQEEGAAGSAVEDPAPAAEPSSPDEEHETITEQATAEEEGEEEVAPATTPDPVPSPELELLKEQNAQLLQTIKSLQASGPKAQETSEETAAAAPSFDFEIPDQLQALLDSENPVERKQGLAHFAKGVAKYAYDQAVSQNNSVMQTQVPQVINKVLTAKSVFEDFYNTYPDLNKPELYSTIGTVADQVSKETGMNQWSPQLKKLIADRVNALLGKGGQPPAPTTKQTKKRAATPNLGGGSGSRPASKTSSSDPVAQEINDTLFG